MKKQVFNIMLIACGGIMAVFLGIFTGMEIIKMAEAGD